MCGGNKNRVLFERDAGGLSPRVRGKPPGVRLQRLDQRSIPACAGETAHTKPPDDYHEVYPRVCGGNIGLQVPLAAQRGLSPRVRGKRRPPLESPPPNGSIPACAGETPSGGRRRLPARVYPRVCGGNVACQAIAGSLDGLSPRVRGKPTPLLPRQSTNWSIPACAGETPIPTGCRRVRWVYPRVCGGNDEIQYTLSDMDGLSPRVRGKHPGRNLRPVSVGSIPACAGETPQAPHRR